MAELPVIVLAFANEQEGHRYLRDLPEELRQLQAILEAAEGKGLCKLVVRQNAIPDEIFEAFTEHRDRVAIFHYGGHAGGDRLFLESIGTEGAVAHAEGLATFLGQRRNLQLVFLNGCSTRAQAAGLLDAGVAAVIATARAIEDAIALEFAAAFYSELAAGATLRAAYEAARGRVLASRGSAPQAYFRTRDLGGTDHVPVDPADDRGFPWELRLAPGAELDGRWSLPEAVGNPLFGLPAPSVDWLPETPYRGLQRFTRDESAVFFGRGRAIREIYNLVMDPGTRPVILYYGPTGVGKSSVLDAGLVPRLEHSQEVRYLRRDPDQGLLGTLRCGLAPGDQGTVPGPSLDLARLWLDRERPDRPLVVILDQAEEAFTRPRVAAPAGDDEALKTSWIDPDAELAELLAALRATFAGPDPARRPRGKLIVSFRNEWLDRFEQAFNAVKLGWEPMPLKPLEPAGIIEAIEGPSLDPTLKRRYQLTVADGLAPTIAKDLVIDAGSALAPTLQVLLTNMWKSAGGKGGRFDQALYRRLRDEGYLLRDVLEEGLKAVRQWHEDVESSGLALDVLVHHVTEFDTAAQRTRAELAARYPHRAEVLPGLLDKLKDGYLLIEADARSERSAPPVPATRLAHDTLAPLVNARSRSSIAPGQRARRLLENRAHEWHGGKTGHILDAVDLEAVETGKSGMRAWTLDEARLVEASRRVEEQRKAQELGRKRLFRNFVYALVGALVVSLGASGVAWIQWGKAQTKEAEANKQAKRARRQTVEVLTTAGVTALDRGQTALAMHQFAEAIKTVDEDTLAQESNRLRLGMLVHDAPGLRAILTGRTAAFSRDNKVRTAAFSPDGKRVVTASYDNTARVWDADSGKIPTPLQGHTRDVYSAAFSPDGKRVVTASDDNTARVWDAGSGEILASLQGHTSAVYSATFSPDGKRVVTASFDKTARVWEVASGKTLASLKGHTNYVWSAAFSPDGKRVVTASGDNTARVWDADSGKILASLKGHTDLVRSAAFSPDGKRVVTASNDDTARVWDAESGKTLASLKGHTKGVNSAAFSPDGKRVVTASGDNTARVWDADSGKTLASLKGHTAEVNSAAFSPDGKRVVIAPWDNTARVWDADSGKIPTPLQGHTAMVNSAAFSPDGKRVVTASEDKTARVWDADSGKPLASLQGHTAMVNSATFSPDGKRAVTASEDKTARVWDAGSGQPLASLQGHTAEVSSAAFSPDGTRIVTASQDKTARVWDADSGKTLASLQGHTRDVYSAAFSPDGKRVVTASWDKTARVWDAGSGKTLASLQGHTAEVSSAAFSPDGKRVVTASWDKTARVWDADSGKTLASLQGHTQSVNSAAFSPDGKRVVTASWDKTARVWDAGSGKTLASLEGHTDSVRTATFSPDGKRVVTASNDDTARVWDAESGKILASLQGHTAFVTAAAFSPDGKRVVTGSADMTALIWPLDPIEGNAGILPLWVEAYTGTELLQGGAVQGLSVEEWKTRCRQLKTAIEQGAKAPPSKWLDELLAQP